MGQVCGQVAGAACVFNLHEGRASKPVLRLVVDRGEGVLQVAYGLALVALEACACQPFGHLC